jgi:hypothetical protein
MRSSKLAPGQGGRTTTRGGRPTDVRRRGRGQRRGCQRELGRRRIEASVTVQGAIAEKRRAQRVPAFMSELERRSEEDAVSDARDWWTRRRNGEPRLLRCEVTPEHWKNAS